MSPVIGTVADNGSSNDTTLTIAGTAESGSTVTIYDTDGITVLGTGVATGGLFTITTSALSLVTHTLTAKATDAAGNQGAASTAFHVTIDTTAPGAGTLSFSGLTDTGSIDTPPVTTDNTFNLSLTGNDAGTVVYEVSTNGGSTWTSTTNTQTSLADGDYQFHAVVTDVAGNSSTTAAIEVKIDTTPPTISGDLGITVNKSGMVVLTTADFQAVDLNNTPGELTFSVSNPTHGHIELLANPGSAITSFTEVDLEAGHVIFVHDGSDTTQATFKVSVSDGAASTPVATTIIATVSTVTMTVLTNTGFDFQDGKPIIEMGAGTIQSSPTSTHFTIISPNYKYVLDGTNFTFNGTTDVTGGTITAIHVFMLDNTPLFDITGSIGGAAAWYHAVVAAATTGDQSQIETLVGKWSFNIVGGAGSDGWNAGDLNDFFQSSAGNDFFDGKFGYDRANYTHAPGAIDVELADGTVTKYTGVIGTVVDSTDTLRSIEFVTGTDFADIFNAGATTNNSLGFNSNSTNAGSAVTSDVNGTFNEFEGRGGNDTIIGNGNTRISYLHATAGVIVDIAAGDALGDASVGHDTFSGVNGVRGSYFDDFLYGSNNPAGTAENFEGRGGNDYIDGRGGFDRAVYANEDIGINVQLAAGIVTGGPNTGIDTLRSIEAITGTESADIYDATGFTTIATLALQNAGSAGVDSNGNAFNEFEGRGGNDIITGNGNTRVAFYNAAAGVTVTLGPGGSGTSFGTAPGDLADVGTDTFNSGVRDVRGSAFGDVITGNGGNNTLEGQGGNDILNGMDGNDTLTGGTGSDIFMYHPHSGAGGNDIITDFNQSEGDRIDLRQAIGSGITNFSNLQTFATITLVGSSTVIEFNNNPSTTLTLQNFTGTLSAADFIFHGTLQDQVAITVQTPDGYNFGPLYDDMAHADTNHPGNSTTNYTAINAAAGLTFSVFGTGFVYDSFGHPTGGTVNAIDIYDASEHILVNSNGWSFDAGQLSLAIGSYLTLNSTGGLDAIFATVSYSAVGNFEPNNQFNNSSVNFGGDTFLSGAHGSIFNGLTNANGDFMNGDTVDYSHAAVGVTVNLSIQGPQAGAGNDTLINIENLRGSAFADHLTGDSNSNVLEGGAGNDTLDGGVGGFDTVSYEHAPGPVTVDLSVTVQQNTVSAGLDTILNFEAVRGSAHDDILIGNDNSVLEGGAGADQLIGQPGGSDTASYEHATAGVTASLLTPGSNTGDAAGDTYTNIANLNGSHFNDTLIGDNNNNVLNGNGGNSEVGDILTGNGGADTFVFSGGKVTVTDFSRSQNDLIDLSNLNFGAGIDASALQSLIDAAPANSHTLDFGNGQVLALTNVAVHTLQTSSDFILHHN